MILNFKFILENAPAAYFVKSFNNIKQAPLNKIKKLIMTKTKEQR